LNENQISYQEIVAKPSPFNIILWTTNVKVEKGYLIGDYSFFDTQPIQFQFIPMQKEWIAPMEEEPVVQQLKRISEGWYCITKKENQLLFNDLRFGVMNTDSTDFQFSFSYAIKSQNGLYTASELPNKNRAQAEKLLKKLWVRMWGN
jgi:inner membrane protein